MLSFTSNPFSFVCVRAILLPTLQRERGGERGRGREREGEGGRGYKGLISSNAGHLFHICHTAFISEASEAHQLRKGIWCHSG